MFQGSGVALNHWLIAIGLATEGSTTSVSLARYLGIKQGAAWRMVSTLRSAASTDAFQTAIAGAEPLPRAIVFADATPMPTAATHGVSYRPKLYLPMSFDEALRRFVAVSTVQMRQARASWKLGRHRIAPNPRGRVSLPEWLDGEDDDAEGMVVTDIPDVAPEPE